MPTILTKKKINEIDSLDIIEKVLAMTGKQLNPNRRYWTQCQLDLIDNMERLQRTLKTEITEILNQR